jgi:hypothetical protein
MPIAATDKLAAHASGWSLQQLQQQRLLCPAHYTLVHSQGCQLGSSLQALLGYVITAAAAATTTTVVALAATTAAAHKHKHALLLVSSTCFAFFHATVFQRL